MEYEFIELEPLHVLCLEKNGEYEASCAQAWQEMINYIIKKNIVHKIEKRLTLGYESIEKLDEEKICNVCIQIEGDDVQAEAPFKKEIITGGRYAVFLHKGAYDGLKNSYIKVENFLQQSKIALRDAPTFERYIDNQNESENAPIESLQTLIYVPIF